MEISCYLLIVFIAAQLLSNLQNCLYFESGIIGLYISSSRLLFSSTSKKEHLCKTVLAPRVISESKTNIIYTSQYQLNTQNSASPILNPITKNNLNSLQVGFMLFYLVSNQIDSKDKTKYKLDAATVKDIIEINNEIVCLHIWPGDEQIMQSFPFFFDKNGNIVGYCSQTISSTPNKLYWILSPLSTALN